MQGMAAMQVLKADSTAWTHKMKSKVADRLLARCFG